MRRLYGRRSDLFLVLENADVVFECHMLFRAGAGYRHERLPLQRTGRIGRTAVVPVGRVYRGLSRELQHFHRLSLRRQLGLAAAGTRWTAAHDRRNPLGNGCGRQGRPAMAQFVTIRGDPNRKSEFRLETV